ncbi:MAG: hypothetical protein AB1938_24705 [Myxococcota bacterium]
MKRVFLLGVVLGVGLACAPKAQAIRAEVSALDLAGLHKSMDKSMDDARRANVACRQSVEYLADELREPCALTCISERVNLFGDGFRLLGEPMLRELEANDAGELAAMAREANDPAKWREPHHVTMRINDAGVELWVAQLEDGGFRCERYRGAD